MISGASNEIFEPFADSSSSGSPEVPSVFQSRELLFNAEVVAAPTSAATVPPCSEDGKVVVHVSTDPATTPKAVDFRIDAGATQLVAASGAVASVITVPGGHHTLEYWAEDEVPQQELVHHSATLQVGGCTPGASAPGTTTSAGVTGQPPAPVISSASQTDKTWREGNALATFSRRHKAALGTTFSFTLNEQATVSFAFTQQVSGRKVSGKCVAQTNRNRRKRACKRTVTSGALSFKGHSGVNRVVFQGRISRSKKLPLGSYTLVIMASYRHRAALDRQAAQVHDRQVALVATAPLRWSWSSQPGVNRRTPGLRRLKANSSALSGDRRLAVVARDACTSS